MHTRDDEAGELNIVPYLDILMNLIIFMILSMGGLATFGILKATAATSFEVLAATMDATRETTDKQRLFPSVTLAQF